MVSFPLINDLFIQIAVSVELVATDDEVDE